MPNASPSGTISGTTISASGSTTIASIASEPKAFSMVASADVTWEDYRTATPRMRRLANHGCRRTTNHDYSRRTVNLILLDERDGLGSSQVTISDARAAHLLNVLKVAPGQVVRIGVLDGPLGVGTVESTDDGCVTLRCVFDAEIPPRPRVDLLLALPRPKVMRRLWAQLAALGVGHIILTNAERVERHYFDTHVLAEACFRPLLVEGLQQARDTRLPTASTYRQFKVLVEDHLDTLFSDGVRLAADPRGTMPVGTAIGEHTDQRVLIAIGPEGGWNAFELALLQTHGFRQVSLGPRTLRVDTACIALLATVHTSMQKK
jgi:16S rRNA (uracil1498-N3)-methyltransferase